MAWGDCCRLSTYKIHRWESKNIKVYFSLFLFYFWRLQNKKQAARCTLPSCKLWFTNFDSSTNTMATSMQNHTPWGRLFFCCNLKLLLIESLEWFVPCTPFSFLKGLPWSCSLLFSCLILCHSPCQSLGTLGMGQGQEVGAGRRITKRLPVSTPPKTSFALSIDAPMS